MPRTRVKFSRDPARRHGIPEQRRQRCLAAADNAVKQPRVVQSDAGEGPHVPAVTRVPRVMAVLHTVAMKQKVAARVLWRVGDQHQMGEVGAERTLRERGEIEVAEDIAVDDHEWFGAQQGQRIGDAASRLQGGTFRRIANVDVPARAVTQGRFEGRAEVGMVDDQIANAGARQRLDEPDDQRLAAHGQQRLGDPVGQRAHALTTTRGQNHGAHRRVS